MARHSVSWLAVEDVMSKRGTDNNSQHDPCVVAHEDQHDDVAVANNKAISNGLGPAIPLNVVVSIFNSLVTDSNPLLLCGMIGLASVSGS